MEYKDIVSGLNFFNTYVDYYSLSEKEMKAYNMAINSLEKQLPKKPILKDRTEVIYLNKGDEPPRMERDKTTRLGMPCLWLFCRTGA